MSDSLPWADKNRPKIGPFKKGTPGTTTERRLAGLVDKTFLQLWSYASPFSDKRGHNTGDGKEICDILAVFGTSIVIFSDKEIPWKPNGDRSVQWSRWYRKAVLKSIDQLEGADRWIRDFPDRIYLDKDCQKRVPFDFRSKDFAVHLISVSSGAESACADIGGDGRGEFQVRIEGNGVSREPFTLYSRATATGFVHAVDLAGLELAMAEFDTAPDFLAYIVWRAQFLQIQQWFEGTERDLIGAYLTEKYLVTSEMASADLLCVEAEEYDAFRQRAEYRRKKQADKISYLWDALIDELSAHILDGTMMGAPDQRFDFGDSEIGLKYLAMTNRFERRSLSEALYEAREQARRPKASRYFRAVIDKSSSRRPTYAFLVHNCFQEMIDTFDTYEKFRIYRGFLLYYYCVGLADRYPDKMPIVGIGLDGPNMHAFATLGGIDLVVLDNMKLDDMQRQAQRAKEEELGLFQNFSPNPILVLTDEFPESSQTLSRQQRRAQQRRNKKEGR